MLLATTVLGCLVRHCERQRGNLSGHLRELDGFGLNRVFKNHFYIRKKEGHFGPSFFMLFIVFRNPPSYPPFTPFTLVRKLVLRSYFSVW